MANLPSIANRLNDVEIKNNAPVTSQTNRRIGSAINYLLDLLNVTNGATAGAPTSGLNVFSPVQSFSYSYSFTNADVNINRVLFTFQGGGSRPLRFFNRTNGFEVPNAIFSSDTSNGVDVGRFITIDPATNQLPIFRLLYQLLLGGRLSGGSGLTFFIVYVNGIEVGRTVGTLGVNTFIQTGEITLAPAQTNTVSVTMVNSINNVVSVPVSASVEYVAT